jgi:hypothetical protein
MPVSQALRHQEDGDEEDLENQQVVNCFGVRYTTCAYKSIGCCLGKKEYELTRSRRIRPLSASLSFSRYVPYLRIPISAVYEGTQVTRHFRLRRAVAHVQNTRGSMIFPKKSKMDQAKRGSWLASCNVL